MKTSKNRTKKKDWQKADARILGQILAAQNIEFVLPDTTHIAEFFAEMLITIPGIIACRVCVEDVSIQKGEMESGVCEECQSTQRRGASQKELPLDNLDFRCGLADQPGMQFNAINSLQHHFGFFVFQIDDLDAFNVYKPFIGNLANYIAISLENRLQRDLLQKAHDELERKVEERTQDLAATNANLQEEIKIRRQTEEALRTSEKQIKQLIDASPVAMIVSSEIEERVDFVNDKFIELFGYTTEDMPDVAHWWPLAYPDENYREGIKAQWKAKVEQAIRDKGQIEPMEATVTCKDGSQRYVEFRLSSIGQKHLVTFVDLTEHKRVEEELQEREWHSQSLLRLSRNLERAQTYTEALNAARDEVKTVVGYQNLWAYLLSEDKKYFKSLVAGGPLEEMVMSEEGTATLAIEGDRMLEEIAAAKEIVVVEDAQTDDRINKEIVARLGNRTIVNVPIILFDRHLGSIGTGTFGDEGVRPPTKFEREYLIALASHMAVTLDRIHLLNKRKQMEQELAVREREYRVLVENIPDLIVRYDTDLRRIYVNPAWERASGLSSRDVINVRYSDISGVPNPVNNEYLEKLQQTLTTETPQAVEFTWVNANGVTLFLEYVIVPEYDWHGKISGVLCVGRDITERKRVEENLRASEEKFRTLIEQSAEGVMLADEDGNIVEWNHAYERITGLKQSQVLGQPLWDFMMKIITPERATGERRESIKAGILEALRTGKSPLFTAPTEMEFHPLSSKEKHYFHQTIFPIKTERGYRIASLIEDITERKKAEAQLLASEQLFRALVENSPDFIARYDREFRRIYVNPAIQKLFGSPAEDVLGKTPADQSPVYAPQAYIDHLRRVIETAIESATEMPYRTSQGEMHWGHMRFVPEFGPDGRVTSVLAIGRDIHEIKENERRFRMLAENFPDFVIRFDRDGRHIYVNPAFEKAFDMPAEAIIGKTLQELPQRSKTEQNNASPNLIRRTFDEGVANESETLWYTKAGGRIFEVRYVPEKDATGNVVTVLCIARDVTERKRAEEELQKTNDLLHTIIEAAPTAIIGLDLEGKVQNVWNPAAEKMLGWSKREAMGNFLPSVPVDKEEEFREFCEWIRSGKPLNGVEVQRRRRDGSPIDYAIYASPLHDPKGQIISNIAVLVDITERKHHEREREAIIVVSNALRRATTRTEIFNVILDQLIDLFDSDGAILVLPNPQTGEFINEMGRGVVGERMAGLKIPSGKGVCNWVIANKKPYLNNHADNDPLFYRPDLLGDSHCIASVPLIAQEQVIGALWIARQTNFVEQDLRLLNAIADIAANAIRRVVLYEQTEQQLHHLLALHQIDIAISNNFDSSLTFNVILNNVKNELEVDAASILLLDPVTHTLDYAAGTGFRTRGIEQSHVKLGDGCAGRAAQECRTVSCPDLGQMRGAFTRFSLLAGDEFVSHYATPLVVKGQVKGVLEIFHRKTFEPETEWLDYYETLATQAAIAIENASLLENLQRSNTELMLAYDATIEGWSRALDLRDRETEGHTQRVADMALELAEKMGMSNTEKQDLWRGSLLHDIGKMGVPDSILLKPGRLTESEWEIMRQHPKYAYQMLSPIAYLKHALEISYCHHEKWDGSGYPRGLKGEEIPLSARVFAVVDVYDALTSDRPYRKAWTHEEVYRHIQEQAGKHFDPQVVKIFLENRPH